MYNHLCSSAELKQIGSDQFAYHSINLPAPSHLVIAKFLIDREFKLPFTLNITSTNEDHISKIQCKLQVNKGVECEHIKIKLYGLIDDAITSHGTCNMQLGVATWKIGKHSAS